MEMEVASAGKLRKSDWVEIDWKLFGALRHKACFGFKGNDF
jgi:hypothetical protein